MMKKTIIFLILHFCFFSAYTQIQKFGKIDKKSLEMKVYSQDSSASAIVLFDIGKSYISFNSAGTPQMTFKRHKRIKIFNKSGYDFADVTIPYFAPEDGDDDHVKDLKANTYILKNGTIEKVKMTKDGIYDERVSEYYKEKKFTLPNVKEGVIIEYTYKVVSDYFTSLRSWYFQSSIPTIWSEYTTSIPDFFSYKPAIWGYFNVKKDTPKAKSSEIATFNINRWYAEDIPAFKPEKYVACPEDYLSRVEFQLTNIVIPGRVYEDYTTTWSKIVGSLMNSKSFGGQLRKKGVVKDVIEGIVKENYKPEEKAKVIYNYVVQNIKWNKYNGISTQKGVRKTLSDKKGNVGDINMLLTLLLKEAGLESNPVLLSTRANGKIITFDPKYSSFNYVISSVKLNNTIFFLDASQDDLPFGVLPYKCLNGQGLIIEGDKTGTFKWIDLNSSIKDSYTHIAMLEMAKEGSISGDIFLKM